MNPNYFTRNLLSSMTDSLIHVILHESEGSGGEEYGAVIGSRKERGPNVRRSAIRDQAIAANDAKKETKAAIQAKAQEIANKRAADAGQAASKFGADDYKAAMAELRADPKFVERLNVASTFRGWNSGGFGGASQRVGDGPVSGMAERGAAAMASQAERDRMSRLASLERSATNDPTVAGIMSGSDIFEPLDRYREDQAARRSEIERRGTERAAEDLRGYEERKAAADAGLQAAYARQGRSYTPRETSDAVRRSMEARSRGSAEQEYRNENPSYSAWMPPANTDPRFPRNTESRRNMELRVQRERGEERAKIEAEERAKLDVEGRERVPQRPKTSTPDQKPEGNLSMGRLTDAERRQSEERQQETLRVQAEKQSPEWEALNAELQRRQSSR